MEQAKNIAQHVVEYLLVLVYLSAAIGEAITREPLVTGVLGALVSDPAVSVIYATWFVVMALSLLYAKIRKRHGLRKYALAAMYLTTVYTITLSVAVFGWTHAHVIDDGLIGLAAAWCWLRTKLNTEYVSIKDLDALDDTIDPAP